MGKITGLASFSIKTFFKNKGRNYVISSQILGAIIALISGKLIAIYVSPEDFGIYSLQWAAYSFFSSLLIAPAIHFIKSTNYTLLPKVGTKYYINTLVILLLFAYIGIITFFYLYNQSFDLKIILLIFFFIPFAAINSILNNSLNITNKLIKHSWLNALRSLSGLVVLFALLVIIILPDNHVLVLWIVQLVTASIGFFLFIYHYKTIKKSVSVTYYTFCRKYLRFAGPLMFLAIWSWINNFFDRYAIEYFISNRYVGIYNANYSVGSKFFIVLIPIFVILVTPFVYALNKKSVKKSAINKYGMYYALLGIPILICVYFLKNVIGGILLSNNYSEGFHIIFWISFAFYVFTLTQLFELIFYVEQKTNTILLGNFVAALVNILCNIILIPKIGISGAAFATCIAFIAQFGITYYKFRKL